MSEIKRGNWMYEIGKTEDNPDAKGLTLLIHPKIKDCVTDYAIYSYRVIKMEVNPQGTDSVTLINAGFKKGYSTVDHLQTINQLVEKILRNSKKSFA